MSRIWWLPVAVMLTLAACERPHAHFTVESAYASEAAGTSDSSDTLRAEVDRNTQRHDFGVVMIGTRPRHAFRVANSSSIPWTIKTIRLSCACTVPRISGQVIRPGSAETVDVEFIAGAEPADLVKTVTVVFAEADVSPVPLTVTAHVRAPLNVVPGDIVVEVDPGETVTGEFSVSNYTTEDWPGIDVIATDDWLNCSVNRLPSAKSLISHPREQWRVQFQVDAQRLGLGRHSSHLQIRATTDANLARSVTVEVRVRSPILVVPSELFFGIVTSGSSVTKTATVRVRKLSALSGDLQPTDIVHDLGEELDVRWTKLGDVSSPLWEIQATFTPQPRTSAENIVRTEVAITFPPASGLPALTIPVRAVISEGEAR